MAVSGNMFLLLSLAVLCAVGVNVVMLLLLLLAGMQLIAVPERQGCYRNYSFPVVVCGLRPCGAPAIVRQPCWRNHHGFQCFF